MNEREQQNQAWVQSVMPVVDRLIWEHNNGLHRNAVDPGCPGCLLSGAIERDEREKAWLRAWRCGS